MHTRTVNVRLDKNVNTTNSVQLNLFILVLPPITQLNQVSTAGVKLLVALSQDRVFRERLAQFASFVGFNPRVVVDWQRSEVSNGFENQNQNEQKETPTSTFNVATVLVAMEPDVCQSDQQSTLPGNPV